MMKKILLLCSILITGITIFLFAKDRSVGYGLIPGNQIFDERNYALQGISIRTSGMPIGYSDSGDYMNQSKDSHDTKLSGFSIIVNGVSPNLSNLKNFPKPVISINQFDFGIGLQYIKFVQPFLDHPPLGGLVYSLGLPNNAKGFMDVTPQGYRKPALYLAIATSILLFILVFQALDNPIIATLSVIVYSSVPTYLFASRYALLENIVAPLALLTINLLLLGLRSKKQKLSLFFIIFAGFISGLAILAKESALGFLIAGVVLLIMHKSGKIKVLCYLGASFIPVIVYILWGLWFFSDLFIKIFIFNATRGFLGSLNFINTFSSLGFKNFIFDGWWIWGFISTIFLFYIKKRGSIYLTVPFFCSLFIILFFTSVNYPWYYFALIPFMAAASGYALWNIITNPDPILLTTFFLFALSSSYYWGYTVLHFPPNAWGYRILITLFTGAGMSRIMFSKNRIIVYSWAILFSMLLLLIIKWNHTSILYLISNWKTVEAPAFPVLW